MIKENVEFSYFHLAFVVIHFAKNGFISHAVKSTVFGFLVIKYLWWAETWHSN